MGIGGAFGTLKYQIYQTQLATAEISLYLTTDPEVVVYEKKLALQDEMQALETENDAIEAMTALIKNRPAFDVYAYAALDLRRSFFMELVDMSYTADGVLSVSFLCPTNKEVPNYVEAVRADGFFRSVRYNGYEMDEGYLFTMICELREVTP